MLTTSTTKDIDSLTIIIIIVIVNYQRVSDSYWLKPPPAYSYGAPATRQVFGGSVYQLSLAFIVIHS